VPGDSRRASDWTGELAAAYLAGGKVQAVATLRLDDASLRAEIAFEQGDEATLQALVPAG